MCSILERVRATGLCTSEENPPPCPTRQDLYQYNTYISDVADMFPSGECHPLPIYRQGGKLKAYSDCPRSRPIPTSHYMDATQLHSRSRQRPRRMDLEKPTRSNPHANYDWLVRSRGMGSRLQNLLQVKHPHALTPSISATMVNTQSLIEIYDQEAGSNNMKVVHPSNATTTACRQIASYEPGARL